MTNKNPLQEIEVRLLNKLSITKDDIFAEDIKRLNGTEEYDATTYVNLKGFILQGKDKLTLSVKLYPTRDKSNVGFYINKKDGEGYVQTQVTLDMFKELISKREYSMNEDI